MSNQMKVGRPSISVGVVARPLRFDPIAEARRNWVANGWSDAADGMALVTSIVRVQQIFLARIERTLAPFGLTFARYEVLMLLTFTRTGQMPLGKIGQRLQVVHVVEAHRGQLAAGRLDVARDREVDQEQRPLAARSHHLG